MNVKIIGYNIKPEYDAKDVATALKTFEQRVPNKSFWMPSSGMIYEIAKKLNVLDLWFNPVYEPIPSKRITLQCESGTFEIEVSQKGIYYAKDEVYLNVYQLRKIIDPTGMLVMKHEKINQCAIGTSYQFSYSHVDFGRMKSVPISDWIKVLDAYDDLQK